MSDYNITDLLSPAFLERMQKMLGDEYEDFIKSYEAPRTYGLRVNTAKISCKVFPTSSPVVMNALLNLTIVMLSAVNVTAIMNTIGPQSMNP